MNQMKGGMECCGKDNIHGIYLTLQYSSHSLEAWGHQDPREGGEYAHFPMKHSPVNPQTHQTAENSCSSRRFWKFYGHVCGIKTHMIESVYLEYRVDHRTVFILKENYYSVLV